MPNVIFLAFVSQRRPRAYERHVPFEYAEELREFIQA
jgi:hypothetical protein